MQISLDNLSGQSFERLARALAFKVFGATACVFSPGPDGGRDLTVEGTIDAYKSRAWDGYLVLQSKYRESRSPQSITDAQWLQTQLVKEKAAFLDAQSGRRVPDYYLLVTNASLSGADGKGAAPGKARKGGYASVAAELTKWKKDIGIRDFDIWHKDKIVDLLSNHPDIRKTFAAWITPSDILHQVMEWMTGAAPDFNNDIRRSIITSLRRKEFAELKDAGSVADQKVRTGQIFIDVPFKLSTRLDDTSRSKINVVAELVNYSRDKLDPDVGGGHTAPRVTSANKIVILGGPGQGKSTISTFLAQIFRSAIIMNDPVAMHDDMMQYIVPEILRRAQDEGISAQVPVRYPAFVSLPLYADQISLAKGRDAKPPSILQYIASDISDTADTSISKKDMRQWLANHPWIIILDGLDEVPPSGERIAVIDAINSITSEVAQIGADVLFLLTTRPQGYNEDLNPNIWQHWELVDLPVAKALSYTTALGLAKYPDDTQRRSKIKRDLEEAAAAPATSRLLVTPLQATILFLIVDTGGSAPTARWSLFNEYFEVLKRREKAKPGEIGRAIERNWNHLGIIHQAIGLILQTRSEIEGGARSKLSIMDFDKVQSAYFKSLGYEGDEISKRVQDLHQLALNRLVLLTGKDEGFVQFDVRSLQEFMAAAALTAGDQDQFERRLLELAGITHWRHVWLIAASRCFADDAFAYRRMSVIGIPRALETSDLDRLVENGARLALELFNDGIGIEHPSARIALAKHAIEGIRYGRRFVNEGADQLWKDEVKTVVSEGIILAVQSSDAETSIGGWALLWLLEDPSIIEVAMPFWPEDTARAFTILDRLGTPPDVPELIAKVRETIANSNIAKVVRNLARNDHPRKSDWASFITGTAIVSAGTGPGWAVFPEGHEDYVRVRNVSVVDGKLINLVGSEQWHGTAWPLIKAIAAFEEDPSAISLASTLVAMAKHSTFEDAASLGMCSCWPLASIVKLAKSNSDFQQLSLDVSMGKYGDINDWHVAESRWRSGGISSKDVVFSDNPYPFGPNIANQGAPPIKLLSVTIDDDDASSFFPVALYAFESVINPDLKTDLSVLVSFAGFGLARGSISDLGLAKRLLRCVSHSREPIYLELIRSFTAGLWEDREFCSLVVTASMGGFHDPDDRVEAELEPILLAIERFHESGLIIVALMLAVNQGYLDQAMWSRSRFPWADMNVLANDLQCSAYCLALLAGDIRISAEFLADLFACWYVDKGVTALRVLHDLTEINGISAEYLIDLTNSLIQKLPDKKVVEGTLKTIIKGVLDRRRSKLTDRSMWVNTMGLPDYQYDALSWET